MILIMAGTICAVVGTVIGFLRKPAAT